MMQENEIIEFLRKKDFKFIQELSNGSFGKTILLKDEYINHQFVCKKYEPLEGIQKEDYYDNFVNEIKLLHLLYHNNIVRIFNYYLYPELSLGYIMMEYIDGNDIYSYIENYPENINSIFEQTIKGFIYLENNNILHRDIRPANILVDNDNNVKIIDFGFGKKINFLKDNAKSITINWWGDERPSEFTEEVYDIKTEIYFIGKLFEEILNKVTTSFKYKSILKKMITINYEKRIDSFKVIQKEISDNTNSINIFNNEEKNIYQKFANTLFYNLSAKETNSHIIMDKNNIIKNLELLQKKTMLEDYVRPRHILKIFISGNYKYLTRSQDFSIYSLLDFFNFFKNITKEKQNIVLYNLETRFDDITTYNDYTDDDIPF